MNTNKPTEMKKQEDAERVAIQKGIDDYRAGRTQPFAEFDAELRAEFGFGSPVS